MPDQMKLSEVVAHVGAELIEARRLAAERGEAHAIR